MSAESLEQRFTDTYDQYADDIFRHCYFRVGDRDLGKELMQEAFMKAWEYLASGKKVENLRAFLYRTANNLVIDYVRSQKNKKTVSFEDMQEAGFDPPSSENIEKDMQRTYTEEEVTGILRKIQEPYRTAVIMRYIDELKPQEIAQAMGSNANVTSVRINRGMKQLRKLLPQYG